MTVNGTSGGLPDATVIGPVGLVIGGGAPLTVAHQLDLPGPPVWLVKYDLPGDGAADLHARRAGERRGVAVKSCVAVPTATVAGNLVAYRP